MGIDSQLTESKCTAPINEPRHILRYHRGVIPNRDLSACRVTLMGLGRFGGGLGAAEFLAHHAHSLVITDQTSRETLSDSIAAIESLSGTCPITYRLGEHQKKDFIDTDLVVANPAVPPSNSYLLAAKQAGIPITTEIGLVVDRLPNRTRIIGITGSAGKSTVSAMIAHGLSKQTTDPVHLGGNLGGSLLGKLDTITPNDWIVLELSSFMLHHLRQHQWSPHIAVLTNLSPNHLDWHVSFDAYQQDKQVILDFQSETEQDLAILGPDLDDVFSPKVSTVESIDALPDHDDFKLRIPGLHNRLNARLAALVIGHALDLDPKQCIDLLTDFPGLAHRLQHVRDVAGVSFFNDSKSTTPEASILAMESFQPGTIHLIAGGYDKGSDLTPLADAAIEHAAGLYTIGQTGPHLADLAERAKDETQSSCHVMRCNDLDTAVMVASQRAQPGHTVLLSPGCASWGQFVHFEARGQRFMELIQTLPGMT